MGGGRRPVMTGRERVQAAVRFAGPDRIPIRHPGLPSDSARAQRFRELYQRYPSDFADVIWPPAAEAEASPSQSAPDVDAWGCRWERLPPNARRVVGHPLASWRDLPRYQFPQHPAPGRVAQAEQLTRDRHEGKCILAGAISFFQQMQDLRGFENLMVDLAQRPPELLQFRDRMLDHHLQGIDLWAGRGLIDCVQVLDDWGIQTGLVAHPRVWRDLFQSAYVRLFEAVHRIGAYVLFHTCGRTIEIIPDLIAAGVDILMVQFSAHTLEELSAACKGKVCILTDPDRQGLLPFGTPDQIRANLQQAIGLLGTPEGGIIGYGEIADPDVPFENAEAVLDVFHSHRQPPGTAVEGRGAGSELGG